jgi:protein involved in polysaccharide export with SLBB domain
MKNFPSSTRKAINRIAISGSLPVLIVGLSLAAHCQQSSPQGSTSAGTTSPFLPSEQTGDSQNSSGPGLLPSSSILTPGQGAGPSDASGSGSSAGGLADTGQIPGSGSIYAMGAPASLSANQIFSILQQDPEVLVELKSLVSDAAQQQGTPIQADAITDEMLYTKIASSSELRANITTFLRARGYVSDDAFQNSADESDNLFPSMQAYSMQVQQFPGMGYPANPQASGLSGAYPGTYAQGPMRNNQAPFGMASPRASAPRNSSSEPQVLHRPTPYNLLSLHDLYTQLPEQNGQLKRFGSEIFLRRNAFATNQLAPNGRETPLDVPAGPSYVVGPGDSLTIDLWGGTSQSFTRVIDREGKLALPEAGAAQVAGLTLERVQGVISDALRRQYRDVQVAVTVGHLRSIRVYVVGDVQRPGAYDISSLSTPLNALYAAGGPTSIGSLRVLRHYRGKQLIGEIDLYDLMLHGVQGEDRVEAGDTLLVPPAGPQVSVYGAVKRPAIYELKPPSSKLGALVGSESSSGTTLASVLEDAGGTTVSAELGHIVIDRIDPKRERETVTLDLPAASTPEAERAAITAFLVRDGDRIHVAPILPYSQRMIYMDGHVARPGRTPYRDGMQLSDVLHSYRDLLPEPADRGEIIRLVPPDLHTETINFNVAEVLIGNANVMLQPFDTVRVFGRYEADAPQVTIGGEVLRPGTYSLSEGMTAAQLVRLSGGFKRDALLTDADLTSYQIQDGTRVVGERTSVRIGEAVTHNDHSADAPLKPGDVLTVHQLTGWNDIGASINIEGEVAHAGSYGFQQGERLSSILRRAGGFRDTSYPAGAVLIRDDVRKLEEKSREELIRQIETSSSAARISPNVGSGDQSATLQLIQQQQNEVLARLRSQPASGRLVIHISSDISEWENTPADIEVRSGDVLRVPKRPGFVLVSGQVYNSSAITYTPGKTAEWYLRRAGGATEIADNKGIFVIRANGSVVGRESNTLFDHHVLSTRLDPGDVVVVPQKIIGASIFWRNLLTVAQVASSVAITAAVAGLL